MVIATMTTRGRITIPAELRKKLRLGPGNKIDFMQNEDGETVLQVQPKSEFRTRLDREAEEMTITLYGIPNCDTVKKARNWLDGRGIAYDFHDYKKSGADEAKLRVWTQEAGWEKILNRAGTTFKKLPDIDKEALDEAKAIRLMLAQPSMIKRPVVEGAKSGLLVGFREAEWEAALS